MLYHITEQDWNHITQAIREIALSKHCRDSLTITSSQNECKVECDGDIIHIQYVKDSDNDGPEFGAMLACYQYVATWDKPLTHADVAAQYGSIIIRLDQRIGSGLWHVNNGHPLAGQSVIRINADDTANQMDKGVHEMLIAQIKTHYNKGHVLNASQCVNDDTSIHATLVPFFRGWLEFVQMQTIVTNKD